MCKHCPPKKPSLALIRERQGIGRYDTVFVRLWQLPASPTPYTILVERGGNLIRKVRCDSLTMANENYRALVAFYCQPVNRGSQRQGAQHEQV